MRPFSRKSRMERLIGNVTDSVDLPDGLKSGLPSGKPAKVGLIAAGSLAALTAASARISSLRRRDDGEA